MPLAFWAVLATLLAGGWIAYCNLKTGTGFPTLAVLVTITVWYIGDAFYNDYAAYRLFFGDDGVSNAWWQVFCFLSIFLMAVPLLHKQLNGPHLNGSSGALRMLKSGVCDSHFQRQLGLLFKACLALWIVLVFIAAIRLQERTLYFFFPFLGYRAEPWGRQRIGTGFDALLSLAVYLQLMVTAIFGVVAALATNRRARTMAIACCFLALPYFIFDRTRNTMLTAIIPGMVSWIFLRLRGGMWKKAAILALCFIIVNAWMAFVISNRSNTSIIAAFKKQGFTVADDARHEGLNMFEELCWITRFIEDGTFTPSAGGRYFAELVNPIPRALWKNKPMIGIDYAIARGQGGAQGGQAGVHATISTGLIGQGVVNFGPLLGPAAAAGLMSLWVCVLARLDLHMNEIGRLPLYGLGMILTFNLGRDITFITLYPFVFGLCFLWYADRRAHQSSGSRPLVPVKKNGFNSRQGAHRTEQVSSDTSVIKRLFYRW